MKFLTTESFPGGWRYTLTTYALKFLDEAQRLYGPRLTDSIYGGIEFVDGGNPHTFLFNDKYVVIRLTKSTADDLKQGIFQLSHEVIHLLSPVTKDESSNLEEGLAVHFSKMITERETNDRDYPWNAIRFTNYLKPYELVSGLLAEQPDAIIELRRFQPVVSLIGKEDFMRAKINFPEDLIDELVKPMIF